MSRGELRLALIGTGYLGGSLSLALRKAGVLSASRGYDVDAAALKRAHKRDIVDEAVGSAGQAVEGADVVVLATPVGATAAVAAEIAPRLAPGALVFDLGSTKAGVVSAVEEALDAFGARSRFVGAHPVAGLEHRGPDAADAHLFEGRTCVLTPTVNTAPDALADCIQLWSTVGARLVTLDPAEHDRVFAVVSHLPHAAAFALAAAVAGALEGDEDLAHHAAGIYGAGFADTTRVAGSNPSMWRDVMLANREALLPLLGRASEELALLTRAVRDGDGDAIAQLVERAGRGRTLVMGERGKGDKGRS